MERKELFENYISDRFRDRTDFSEKKLDIEFNSYDRNYKNIIPPNKNASILEIGFGTGYFIKYLLKNSYKNIYGIEMSKEETEFVKENIYEKVESVENTENFLAQHQNEYDFIYMSQVLEHVPKKDTIDLLRKIKDSLKKNGIFVANTPNANNPFNINVFAADFSHEFIFNPESLKQVCRITNFSEIKIIPFKEEDLTWHGKITNKTAPILYFILRILMGLGRSYISPSKVYSANIFCICKK